MIKLSEICEYVNERVETELLTEYNYISTDNMVPNKGGIRVPTLIPIAKNVKKFIKGDILISNIRIYFKKIWYAEFDGGCSNDILVIRANKNINSQFLYYLLSSDNFFAHATATSKGTKMPRGDKSSIMSYLIPFIDIKQQGKIACILKRLDNKISLNKEINNNLAI